MPLLAILNLYQSFWEKIWNGHFWPFQIYTSLFGKNCQKKFRTANFSHSKFIPFFLGKIIGKNSEWQYLAILNLYQSFMEKMLEKKSEWLFLVILNLYQTFWEKLLEKFQNGHIWPFQIYTSLFRKNCWRKFGMAIFGHSEFIPVSLGKIIGKNLEWPFLSAMVLKAMKFVHF